MVELRRRQGTVGVLKVQRRAKPIWFDHVKEEQKMTLVSACRNIVVAGYR